MILDRKLVATVLVCLAAGWWLGSSPASPINPKPHISALAIGKSAHSLPIYSTAALKSPGRLSEK